MILKRLIPLAPALAALAILLSLSVSDTAYGSFSPELSVTVADTTAQVPSDYVLEFSLPEGDVNFAGLVGFIPEDWGIVDGRDIPIGAEVGLLRADATLGIIGSPCNQVLPIEFKMLNSSLDQNDFFVWDDDVAGGRDGDGNPIENNVNDWAEDINENGLIGAVDQWPEFIFRVLEDTTEAPIRRSAGFAIVASTPILLQFLIFPPGTFLNENIPNDESLGYPSVTLLQNIGDPEINPEPSAITDFCSPLSTTNTSFGITQDNEDTEDVDEGGYTLFVNPQDGEYTFTVASAGQRDADGDSYENTLDTCALDVNVGNPRINNDGDLDFDGLDAACDPNDDPSTGGTNSDQDGDGYLNRQDNCPLVANGEDLTNQADADEDGIGDVCDPNPDNADTEGTVILNEAVFDITIGAGGAGGPPDCSVLTTPDGEPLSCWTAGSTPTDTGGDNGGDNGASSTDDDDGSSSTLIIIIGVIAVIVVFGGGATVMMRRSKSA